MKWVIIVVVAGAVIGGGVWHFKHRRSDAPEYEAEPVMRGDLTQVVTATGTLNPVINVTVGSQVSGRITMLFVDFNSIVKSNEVIAEIDPSTYEAQLNQVTANLSNAKANLELQQANLKRAQELYTNNLLAESDYDSAVATRDEAAAQVQIQEASLHNASVNLSYCKIRSPVDGVVISRAVELGQTVASSFSTPTLFQIANDLTKMQIDSSVAEADVGGVAEGQDVNFTVDAYPYRNFHGVVTQVRNSPTTVNNVVTYDCVIGVTNGDYKLKPGMTANVSIIIAQRENALTIPNSALRFHPLDDAVVQTNAAVAVATEFSKATNGGGRGGGAGWQGRRGGDARARGEHSFVHTVYLLSGGDKNPILQAVQIKTGISDGLSTEVVSGLKEGDQVVTGLNLPAMDGSAGASNPFGGGFPRRR